jgi:hypothetical protein
VGRAEISFFNGSAHAVGKQARSSKLEKLSHGIPQRLHAVQHTA